jgi:hypothetical protein
VPGVWGKGIGVYLIFFIFLINLAVTTAFVLSFRVSINSQGIRCPNFWGKSYFVEWSTITGARCYGGFWTLGFKFILISSNKISKALWLPLFLNKMPLFKRLVSDYTSTSNPIIIQLNEQKKPAYLLKQAETQIKLAWQAGIVSGTITLVLVLLSLAGYKFTGLIDASAIIDVCLVFGLSYGIYKKSRVAAIIMLLYFIFSKTWIAIELNAFPGFFSWLFLIFYLGGVQGTVTYRKLSIQN